MSRFCDSSKGRDDRCMSCHFNVGKVRSPAPCSESQLFHPNSEEVNHGIQGFKSSHGNLKQSNDEKRHERIVHRRSYLLRMRRIRDQSAQNEWRRDLLNWMSCSHVTDNSTATHRSAENSTSLSL